MSKTTTEFTSGRAGPVDLTESERHDLLAAERRRLTLDVLAERVGPVELEALAAAVAAREGEHDEETERVAICLHHAHLPKMDDLGVLNYDPDARRVELLA